MSAESLLNYYEKIIEAPDAIDRLRRFILDLAVRGKLVPQDANDEPASELLKRIANEKTRLVKAKEIRAPKAIPTLSETPFPIPSNWRWSQLAEIGVLSPRNEAPDTLPASFVPMPMIAAEYGVSNQHEIRPWGNIKKGYTHFAEGDIGLAKITPCFENGKSTVFRNLTGGIGSGTTELHIVRPLFVDQDYILLFLKSPHFIETGIPKMTGTAGQKRVPTEYFANSPFPLPPLAEQHRIVAKVDELMALCDQLEAARAKREATRDQFVSASLDRLTQGETESFKTNSEFAISHLALITQRQEHVKRLRKAILDLAVRGKLVPQDPNDEPASELLKRAKQKKEDLRRQRCIGRDEYPEFSQSQAEGLTPISWQWIYLSDIALVLGGKRLPRGSTFSKDATDHVYIRVSDMKNETISQENLKFISEEVHQSIKKYTIDSDDLYITIAGTIGEVGIVPPRFHGQNLTENAAKIVFRDVDRFYLLSVFRSSNVQSQIKEKVKQMAQPKLALKRVLGTRIPLPPLAEQRRIVAKVDELMALCDQLENSLATESDLRSRLLKATLEQTLEIPAREAA